MTSAQAGTDALRFQFHPSFDESDAERRYGESTFDENDLLSFMPDDVTRDFSRRMHYAAWRVNVAKTRREGSRWRNAYLKARNGIVLGNRKLIFRAVQRWTSYGQCPDDLVGECQLVFIKAVATYNPWLGIRFSTYAVTCLIRALSRLVLRQSSDRLSLFQSLESLPDGEPSHEACAEATDPRLERLNFFLQDSASLLTAREKLVISRRFHLHDQDQESDTLEQVGRDLGLSKERVRQVQKSALQKLREALSATSGISWKVSKP
jgi:RNA polymerase sigma factor (sigma-70 family)